jgi:hypothetical protein
MLHVSKILRSAPSSLADCTAYVKAAARDIKSYLKGINSGALVGYAAVDGEPAFRDTLAHYLTCGAEDIVVDLYGECAGFA